MSELKIEQYPHDHPLHKAVFIARESYTGGESFEEGVLGLIAELKDARKAQGEVQRLREAISVLADIAHEHRRELMQHRFPDNDEGDAFARHRDSRVGRIDRILQAALSTITEETEK